MKLGIRNIGCSYVTRYLVIMQNYLTIYCILSFRLLLKLPSVFSQDEFVNAEEDPVRKNVERENRYQYEISQGSLSDLLSHMNTHVPQDFGEFSRRFVLQYPYIEKTESQVDEDAEARLDRAIRKALKNALKNNDLRPVEAPPEVVLAVVRDSLRQQQEKPVDPNEFDNDMLRSGDFWNAAWKEEVPNPEDKLNLRTHDDTLKSVRVNVMPGSKLHKLITLTKQISPRLLYIINSNKEVNK